MGTDKNGMSVKEFIDKNQALLSALAIFATLATLLGSLPIKWMAAVFSFIAIAGMVIVWHEINAQLPEKMSLKLFLFRYVLLWGLGGLVFYWLLEFREIWHIFLFIPLAVVFTYEILLTLSPFTKHPTVKWVFGIGKQKNWFQKILKVITILIVGYFSLFLAGLFSTPLNLIFDLIKNTFK